MTAATQTTELCEAVLDEMERAVVGKRAALTLILTTVLARGHVLIEDLPGMGKTLIARSFAAALGLRFTRVQFTPDLLPADLLGSTIYDMRSGQFEFRRGPIFANLLMADEINRTPRKPKPRCWRPWPRARSASMAKPTVSQTLSPSSPPRIRIEFEGTYLLPEAQPDRFAVKVGLKYLSEQEETSMLRRRLERGSAEAVVNEVVDADQLLAMQESVEQVTVHDDVLR